MSDEDYGWVVKVFKFEKDFFGEEVPSDILIRYRRKLYRRIVRDGPSSVTDWDSMEPPPADYRYVIINGKEVLISGTKVMSSRAGEMTPFGKRDIYGGL